MKFKTVKFSSEGLGGNSTKFCTSENFVLYGIIHTCILVHGISESCKVTSVNEPLNPIYIIPESVHGLPHE